MTPNPDVQERLRRYLLGQLADDSLSEEIEKDLLASDELFEELLVVEDEIIDEYLSGKLDHGERAAFEELFLATPERHDKLRFGRAFNRYLSAEAAAAPVRQVKSSAKPWAWTQTLFSSPLRTAAFAIIIVGIAFGVWRIYFHQSEVDKGLLALNAAYRQQRPLESRISSLDYAPFSQTRGGPERVDTLARNRAEAILSDAVGEKTNADALHALGRVYLAKKQFDDAIKEFDEALKSDPKNAQLYSDLGAAWLEKGKLDLDRAQGNRDTIAQGEAIVELAKSLENIERALKLSANLPEALFNRALYHQNMRLRDAEGDDWREYLRHDPNSPWAEEARRRLAAIDEQKTRISESKEQKLERFRRAFHTHDDASAWELVSSYHNRSGNLIIEQLLNVYLAASVRNDSANLKESLASLVYAGQLAQERSGDSFFSDLTRYYATITSEQRVSVLSARALMSATHEAWGQARVDDSLQSFTQANKLFAEAGDDCEAALTDYWVSFCYYRDNRSQEAAALLTPLIKRCESSRYFWLLDRVLYLMASVQFKLNQHSSAIDFANRSADIASRINDKVGILNAITALAEFYRYLGNNQRALSYVARGFGVSDSIDLDQVQAIRVYAFQATTFAASGLFAAAADYQHMALRAAVQSGRSAAISSNYSFLALINWKLGDYAESLRNSQAGFDIAQAHSQDRDDQNLMAFASLQMGHASRLAGNFDKAEGSYDRSIKLYEKLNLPTNLYQAHKGRLFCYVAQQKDDLANTEISTATDLAEEYRNEIFEENTRDNFFDAEQSVFDTAIDFQHSRMQNDDLAFWYAERSRARSLLDLINSDIRPSIDESDRSLLLRSASRPRSADDIRAKLPPGTKILEYAVLDKKLITFVLSHDRLKAFSEDITASDLSQKTLGYLNTISNQRPSDQNASESASRELFNLLIRPLASELSDARQVCIVPDKVLNFLPFAALMSESGRYLVQDYVLETAPSSSVYFTCSEIAQKKSAGAESALVIGNPRFDRDRYPELSDLPSAVREAKEVANIYGQRPWLEDEATATVALRRMRDAEVIELALHTMLDEQYPLRSKLVFAKAGGSGQDSLAAYDLYGLSLPRTRLVVLSSCQTAAEQNYKGEGMLSLARPFIAARVPLVVASMWPVESNSTADLMIRFHRLRRTGNTTAAALAIAQREMLSDAEPELRRPYYWAAFTLIGGDASF